MTNEEILINTAKKYGITSPLELSHFLGQCSYESGGFKRLVENLNYTPDGLLKTFPKYFTKESANICGRTDLKIANQQGIANIVYGGRMGNRAGTNDGANFIGRGFIQLTGRDNYQRFSTWLLGEKLNYDVITTPSLVATDIVLASLSAIWFWKTNSLSSLASKDDVDAITKKINGGTHGLQDRKILIHKYKKQLGIA